MEKSYKNRLKGAIAGDDAMNYHYFRDKGLNVQEIISLADTIPFFGERRLIQIEDSGFSKSAVDALVEYLPTMPDTTYILFVGSEVDEWSRVFKKVKELGHVAEVTGQDTSQLAAWAGGVLRRERRNITRNSMELLLSKVEDDMESIRMELEKLVSYTLGRGITTDQNIEAICTMRVTNKIFDMVIAIVNYQTRRAVDLYENLLTLKEPPVRILFLIARQFNQILQVKELMAKGMDKGSITSKSKMQPFMVGEVMPQAKSFSREQILSYVNLCVDAEEAMKTGYLGNQLAVEPLITKKYQRM